MSNKQKPCLRYVYKIHSNRLKKSKWNLYLPIEEARRNGEVISLSDSQILRWINELKGFPDADETARMIAAKINRLKEERGDAKTRRKIKKLYSDLDKLLYQPDYLCLIIDKEKDYWRACKGFSVNGINYKRLVGTNGGIKNSTIVFVSETVFDELSSRINNGRDLDMKLVPAKLEAYKALTCSASTPVSFPRGILIVNDCETKFTSDIVSLTDECEGEPEMKVLSNQEITINASDGFGLMLPSLAERWSEELGLDYTMSGGNTRFAYEKGMAITFDFLDFAEKVAGGKYTVRDAWGNEADIRNVELILTTSMVKLWDSYPNCEEYVRHSLENHYTFGITKVCPRELENERHTNYQFLNGYNLTDEEIEELITPTLDEIRDVLHDDWRKSLVFLKGKGLNAKNAERANNDFAKAIMIDPRMIEDSFVQDNIYHLIKNRINEAKVGVIKAHGNYSIACGDPYALCQSLFGLPVTGLLKGGEIYNKYWIDHGAKKLSCFRAPMTDISNVRSVVPVRSPDIDYWFRYIQTATVFSAWSVEQIALNGMDYDGDLVMLTDNPVLVNKLDQHTALMCVQRKAEKKIPTEEDTIRSNISSFGNDIGKITNRVTSMYEVRSHFPVESIEYKTLGYRIKCGQLYQQNAIDKAKGIISKPMPRTWYDRHAVNKMEDEKTRSLYRNIVADKKPYFMCYIYPDLMREYKQYKKNTDITARRKFGMTVEEILAIPDEQRTKKQSEFIYYYKYRMPVGTGGCVVNKICKRFEDEFDSYFRKLETKDLFDYTIMKSGAEYTKKQYYEIKNIYTDYSSCVRQYTSMASSSRMDKNELYSVFDSMRRYFTEKCEIACPNSSTLCDILLDICYRKKSSKKFVWDICAEEIIHNLLKRNHNVISFPTLDDSGDMEYGGDKFKMETAEILKEDDGASDENT